MKTVLKALTVAGLLMASAPASAQVAYTINGQPTPPDVTAMLAGQGLPYGHYWLLPNGNWGVMGSYQVLGNIYAGAYKEPGVFGGSGEVYDNGAWSHYSPLIGDGGVGGDGNGCLYAYGWSNC